MNPLSRGSVESDSLMIVFSLLVQKVLQIPCVHSIVLTVHICGVNRFIPITLHNVPTTHYYLSVLYIIGTIRPMIHIIGTIWYYDMTVLLIL